MVGDVRATRARKIWFATIATVGLAGAVYAAEQATATEPSDLQQTIEAQRISEGRLVRGGPISEHQLQAFSPDQMIALGEKYRLDMKAALDHLEQLRIAAYRSRDLIRMTCVDDKLTLANTVVRTAEPKALALARETEALPMRGHFSLVRLARERVNEIVAEADECMGVEFGTVGAGRINEEGTPSAGDGYDPSRVPEPTHIVDRPGEASPYR
jgi:hypothetical protein